MLVRVVQLHLRPETVPVFLEVFATHQKKILENSGCISVQLLQLDQDPGHLATLSHWTNQEALDHYRHSEFFRGLWSKVKPMFSEKAQAFSYHILDSKNHLSDEV
jgi:quinol monooxygenase YgiN